MSGEIFQFARFVEDGRSYPENQNQNTGNAVYVLAGSCKRRGRTEKAEWD